MTDTIPFAVQTLVDAIVDAVKAHDGQALQLALTRKFIEASDELRKSRTKFPKQDAFNIPKSQWLESTLFSFLKTKHIFRAMGANIGLVPCQVAWSTLTDLTNGIARNRCRMDLPPAVIWGFAAEFMDVFSSANSTARTSTNAATGNAPETPVTPPFLPEATLAHLRTLVANTKLPAALKAKEAGTFTTSAQRSSFVLGLFAQVALVQLHVLFGDFRGALREASNLLPWAATELLFRLEPAAHSNFFFHVGVAYMMMRRYCDAAKAFKNVSASNEKTSRSADRLRYMISVLAGLKVDEALLRSDDVAQDLRDLRGNDKNAADKGTFRRIFVESCPHFWSRDELCEGTESPGVTHQAAIFTRQVEQMLPALKIRGYMQAFKVLSMDKAAGLMETDKAGAAAILTGTKLASCELVRSEDNTDALSYTIQCPTEFKLCLRQGTATAYRTDASIQETLLKRIKELRA